MAGQAAGPAGRARRRPGPARHPRAGRLRHRGAGTAGAEAGRDPGGAEPGHFPDDPPPDGGPLQVLFYSTFIPLHGVLTVARAIRQLQGEDIAFTIVGRGQDRAAFDREVAGLSRVTVHDWVPYERLGTVVADHHVVLGLFGDSGKARRVVPGKVYQAACAGRAIVTADTPAVRSALDPDEVVLVPPGDADALAAALRELIKDRTRVTGLGRAAHDRYERDYTPAAIGRRLGELLSPMAKPEATPEWVRPPRFLLRLDLVRRLLPRLPKDQPVLEVGKHGRRLRYGSPGARMSTGERDAATKST